MEKELLLDKLVIHVYNLYHVTIDEIQIDDSNKNYIFLCDYDEIYLLLEHLNLTFYTCNCLIREHLWYLFI